MHTILGIDAAWTGNEPSGVALVIERAGAWQCVAVAPSYSDFLGQSESKPTNWMADSFPGALPDVPLLLRAAERLAGGPVDLVTLDMPVACAPFSSRRAADNSISREFGARWCSAHTPNASRPGRLGAQLSKDLGAAGFPLVTSTRSSATPALLEVYPHPALLSLLKRAHRVPYKISKAGKYWPGLDVRARIALLLEEFGAIHAGLSRVLGSLPFVLPPSDGVATLTGLKRYEDALDALVCAWVGIQYLCGQTLPLGDDNAAIWCPADVVHRYVPVPLTRVLAV